jgi:uncharacterized protein YkwD
MLRWPLASVASCVALAWSVGCALPATAPEVAPNVEATRRTTTVTRWASETVSPQRVEVTSPLERELLSLCQRGDAGLDRVARALAQSQALGNGMLDSEHVTHELRAAGVPQVWPRAWAIVGNPSVDEAKAGLAQWLASFSEGGERRCGVGTAKLDDGREVISVLAVDALADLSPMPIQARLGQWIQVKAHLLEAAVEAEIVVLGPRGAPRTVPTTLHGAEIRGTFSVDQVGGWKVQVLPTFPSGPRPVLEALVFVDQDPPVEYQASPVPGEDAAIPSADPATALFSMLNRARTLENLGALRRTEQLDAAAKAHAEAMMQARTLAHDVGAGNPGLRLQALGLHPKVAGENVAHALSVVRSHRALWESPSHRSNLLHPAFTHVGIGLALDTDGSYWVCEMFVSF